ncbi:hypothetical protein C4D60_Mb06t06600 [Musa balbisiana]|uniref:Uncharacterized protein n=1 Tax=Musa balbisiana TaxID=52838 RepID=A0A4S8IL19_MUSBA|nr:hypothetical protein C4D60_Mb06t06600 [Musa balbisiana]
MPTDCLVDLRRPLRAGYRGEGKRSMWWQSYVDDHLMREVVGQHHTAAGGAWAQTAFFPQVLPHLFFPGFPERIKISMIFVVDRINHVGHGGLHVEDVQKNLDVGCLCVLVIYVDAYNGRVSKRWGRTAERDADALTIARDEF